MPDSKKHFDNCFKELGNGYGKVHKWLDQHAGLTYPLTAHRCITHHHDGINEVRKIFGEAAALAAQIHIQDDLEHAGYNRNYIPEDREDSKRFWGDIDDHIEGD